MSDDAQQALAQVREALANEALFDPGASTADTYSACKAFGTACTPENVRAILAHVEAQAAEIERLREAGIGYSQQTVDALTAERDKLRRQLAEAELDAERYRWLAGHCRTSIEHWGGRWSIIVDGPVPKAHDSENAFDAAIDAAMGSNMTDALKEPRDQR